MKLRQVLNKLGRGNGGKAPLPRDAYFLLVDKCNARCAMCQDDYFRHTGNAITLDKFKIIAANLRLQDMKSAVLAGGDPLLNRDLLEIISFINGLNPNINVVICTNAIALTPNTSEGLLQRNVYSLSVSVNAATGATYQKVAQVDCFDRVIANVKHYLELLHKLGKPLRMNLSFVATRKNIEELPEFIKLAASLGIKDVSSTYCRFFPIERRLSLAANEDNLLQDSDSLYFHQALSDKYFKEADDLARQLGINFTREPLFSEMAPKHNCQFPFNGIMVGFDGEVFPCCGGEVIFKDKVTSGVYDFSNVLKQPIEAFWWGESYQALRHSALHPDNPAVPECGACSAILSWKGNIEAAHIMAWDDLKGKSIDFGLSGSRKR
ncbi:MAG: radical SAM protein [Dehalococcoidales bacterium]|nr:radical SAM protein [Dehalococcoidales bacterium]